jgi:hypothetical protein
LRTLIHDHFFYLLELICAEGAAAIGKHAVGSGVTNKTLEILHITTVRFAANEMLGSA